MKLRMNIIIIPSMADTVVFLRFSGSNIVIEQNNPLCNAIASTVNKIDV